MAANAPAGIAPSRPGVACAATEGCSYLRALSTIEHIAGFGHTARSYAASAASCSQHGCWAAATQGGKGGGDGAVTSALMRLEPDRGTRRRGLAAIPQTAVEAIPFTRSALIDILSDSDGNFVERRALRFSDLPAKGDALGYLYRYWSDLRGAGALQFSNIDTVHLSRAGVIGKMHVVDVDSADPADFCFELFGYAVPLGRYERPCALPVPIYAKTTMIDYNTARMTAAPRLHRVRSRLNETSYHYTRLILPFVNLGGRVNRLLVAIRQEAGDGLKLEARN
jgi:hypothetical protein